MSQPLLAKTLRRSILRRYGHVSLGTRLFLQLRWGLTPYRTLADFLPTQGLILDLGSGHGLLTLTLALTGPQRQVRGIDHDPQRVAMATEAGAGLANAQFMLGSLDEALPLQPQDAPLKGIVILDALHYLAADRQEELLRRAWNALPEEGVLLVREVDSEAGFAFWSNRLHEKIMTSIDFTRGPRLVFRGRSQWTELLEDHRFRTTALPMARFPFADILFVCRKTRLDRAVTLAA